MPARIDDFGETGLGVNASRCHRDAGDDPAGGRERVRAAEGLARQVFDALDAAVGAGDDLPGVGRAAEADRRKRHVGAFTLVGYHVAEGVQRAGMVLAVAHGLNRTHVAGGNDCVDGQASLLAQNIGDRFRAGEHGIRVRRGHERDNHRVLFFTQFRLGGRTRGEREHTGDQHEQDGHQSLVF